MKKKTLLSLVLGCGMTLSVHAQSVYNEIREKSQTSVTQATNDVVKQINQFKVDALDYMLIKMREQMPDSTTSFLDKQAFAMNNFVNFYIQQITEMRTMPQAYQVKVMQLFMDASLSNPLFNDSDKELTLGYFANSSCLTRFSLDTDWRKASAAVAIEIKNIK